MFSSRERISSPCVLNIKRSGSVSNSSSTLLVEGRVGGALSSSCRSSFLSSVSPSIALAMISSSLEKETDVTIHYPDQQMIKVIDLVEWHHYPTHAFSPDPPAKFLMDCHHRSLLPVGLIDLCS